MKGDKTLEDLLSLGGVLPEQPELEEIPQVETQEVDVDKTLDNIYSDRSDYASKYVKDPDQLKSVLDRYKSEVESIKKAKDGKLGDISGRYESRGDYGAISSGKGDAGGKSYGKYQLSSKKGTLDQFLNSEEAKPFKESLSRGGDFDSNFKSLAEDKGFQKAQEDFIKRTHYDRMVDVAENKGLDVDDRRIQEALFSLGVQHKGAPSIVEGADVVKNKKLVDNLIMRRESELDPKEPTNDMASQELEDLLQQEKPELPESQAPAGDIRALDESRLQQELAVPSEAERDLASEEPSPKEEAFDYRKKLIDEYKSMLEKKPSLDQDAIKKAQWMDAIHSISNTLNRVNNRKQGPQTSLTKQEVARQQAAQKAEVETQLNRINVLEKMGKLDSTKASSMKKDLRDSLAIERLGYQKKEAQDRDRRFKESQDRRKSEDFDKKISKVSTRLEKSGILEMTNAVKGAEDFLRSKFGIEELGEDMDKSKLNKVSIAGVGVGGGLRPDFLTSADEVDFRQNIQKLANTLLKARSGAAVTDTEYRRFLKEVGSGSFSSEKDLINGLVKMKKDIKSQTSNILKNQGSDVMEEYMDRTGVDLYVDRDGKKEGAKKYSDKLEKPERVTKAPAMESDSVMMEAPTGEKVRVKKDKVEMYLKKGARVIGN